MTTPYIPSRALFIYAHPDDIEFGVAGTAALWAKHQAEIRYIIITDGNVGSHDMTMTGERLAALRRQEQDEAARLTGVQSVVYLGYPDGMLEPTLTLRRELVRQIRRFRPNALVCGDPTVWFPRDNYINHPDHRAAAQAAIEAAFPAPNSPLLFPELLDEGLAPCDINYVYISAPNGKPNYYVDISETLTTKIAALKAHQSQIHYDPTERLTDWARQVGREVGLDYAEAFRRITLKEPDQKESEEDDQEL